MATGYHNFDEYVQGEDNWDYNDEFRTIDKLLWRIGQNAAKPTSPPDESIYLAVDTNEILRYDASNNLWNTIIGGGGGGGGGGSISVEDDDTTIESDTSIINFGGNNFDVTRTTDGQVLVAFTNDSFSVLTGDGLTGGQQLTLGGSTTISLDQPVEDDGTELNTFDTVDYGAMLTPTDNGDGSYTVDGFFNVEDSGTDIGDGTTLNFADNLTVTQTGDTFTIDGAASGDGSSTTSLKEGQLGTLSTTVDHDEFEITGIAENETQGVGAISVFPRTAINDSYTFNAIDWKREWDESNNRLDLIVTVAWDEKPSSNLDLDYVVWEGAGGTSGSGGDTTVSTTVSASTSYASASWNEVVWGYTSGGNISVELPTPSSTGQFTVKKIDEANTLTVTRPGTEEINGSASDLQITDGGVSRTFSSDGTNYEVI